MLAADLEALVLAQARRGLGPNAGQRRLALERLALGLRLETLSAAARADSQAPQPPGTASVGTGEGVAGSLSAATNLGGFSLRAMVVGVLTGAVVGFGVGVVASSGDAPRASASAQHLASDRDDASNLPHARREERAETTAVLPAPPATSAHRAVPPDTARQRRSEGVRQPSSPPAPSTGPVAATFYEELSYVRRAQSALHEGNAILALGLMRSLDEIHPSGALLAERNMTRVLALCELGRTAEARVIARGMLNGDGTAEVYRRRLATSCAGASHSEPPAEQDPVKDEVE